MLLNQQKKASPYQYHTYNDTDITLGGSFRSCTAQEKKTCLTNDPLASQSNSPRLNFAKFHPVLSRDSSEIQEGSCKNCQLWKAWATLHQREMLELQQQLIQREQKLIKVMSKQKIQLNNNKIIIQQLQLSLKQQKQKIVLLQAQIGRISQKIEQITPKVTMCETPKKIQTIQKGLQNRCKGEQVVSLDLSSIEKTEKYRNLIKTSGITTKTEGWGCQQTLKKEKLSAHQAMTKRSDFERCLFQNQTLRDYNSTLLDRLASTRFKKSIY